ncbi:hypothetical protein ACFSTC_30995 [Nonomuraea ferruginea]
MPGFDGLRARRDGTYAGTLGAAVHAARPLHDRRGPRRRAGAGRRRRQGGRVRSGAQPRWPIGRAAGCWPWTWTS